MGNAVRLPASWPSVLPSFPVKHNVEYRSSEQCREIPGFEQRAYNYQMGTVWLNAKDYGTSDALRTYFLREFRVEEKPGHEFLLFWAEGQILEQTVLNQVLPNTDIRALINTTDVNFMFVYIPIK